jgi:hypothetical protein
MDRGPAFISILAQKRQYILPEVLAQRWMAHAGIEDHVRVGNAGSGLAQERGRVERVAVVRDD